MEVASMMKVNEDKTQDVRLAQLPVLSKQGKYKLYVKDCGKVYELREDAKVTVNIR
ncbi:hypothetical protein [Clostridium thailandense]|uniref:hypothetical protein n=1 Tax=Clostridium thailandense TaxID=2794346 RepID=UPI003988D725